MYCLSSFLQIPWVCAGHTYNQTLDDKTLLSKIRTAHNYLCMIFLVIADKLIKISQLQVLCIDCNFLSYKKRWILLSDFDISTYLFYLWQHKPPHFSNSKSSWKKISWLLSCQMILHFCKYLPVYYVPTGQFLKSHFLQLGVLLVFISVCFLSEVLRTSWIHSF